MKKINNLLLFVAAFFLGMFVCVFFFKSQGKKYEDNEKLVLNLLKKQNDNLSWLAGRYLKYSTEQAADTTMYQIMFLKDMNSVSNYFNTILSTKKYDLFSIDTVKLLLENSIRLNNLSEEIKQISFQNNTPIEKELYLNLYYNIILNNCFEVYHSNCSFTVGNMDCVFVPKKDTVKMGDYYEARIYFAIKDITHTYRIADTADYSKIIFEGDVYREKAITKGLNTRKGLLPFFNNDATLCLPVEFSFYVE